MGCEYPQSESSTELAIPCLAFFNHVDFLKSFFTFYVIVIFSNYKKIVRVSISLLCYKFILFLNDNRTAKSDASFLSPSVHFHCYF